MSELIASQQPPVMELHPAVGSLLRLQPADRLLLCTDGLTGMIDEWTMGGVLLDVPDDEAACHRLIDSPNETMPA